MPASLIIGGCCKKIFIVCDCLAGIFIADFNELFNFVEIQEAKCLNGWFKIPINDDFGYFGLLGVGYRDRSQQYFADCRN